MSLPAPFITDVAKFRADVIKPALEFIGLWTPSAENLVLGTSAHESMGWRYRKQNHGPALGLWQVEPATHKDLWENFLQYHIQLANLVKGLLDINNPDRDYNITNNDRYAAAICRVQYYRQEKHWPVPTDPNDIPALGALWKQVYNTERGRGTVDEFVNDYKSHILMQERPTA